MGRIKLLGYLVIFTIFYTINVGAKSNLITLDEDNWQQILTDEWMVEFYAPWCPACKGLGPVWKDFAEWSKDLGIKVGQVDVTTSPGLSGRFMVTALPTIFHVLNGEFRQYKGTRDKSSFLSFIEEKKWKTVEAVPGWKAPDSVQMSVVAWFFKLSQILRGIHNQLMVEYGLPTWGSYLIFALATILLGAVLGLVLVCMIDFVYPPTVKTKNDVQKKNSKEDVKQSGDELADEDIKDDLLDDANASQSEGEKYSDSEENNSGGGEPDSPSVRKRKARKAD